MTLRALSTVIERNSGVISRYESGERTPKPEHVSQILTTLAITGERYDAIMTLAYDTDAPMWVAATLPEQHQQLAAFVEAEQNATHIADVSPLLVPGLLQTNEYIRAIMSGGGMPHDEVVRRAAIRIGLRDIITRQHSPTRFTVFIGEAALYQLIGGRDVMVAQLRHLLSMVERPNVFLRIVPFGSGWHPGLEGPFTVVDPEEVAAVVQVENRKSGIFMHEKDDVALYLAAVDMVRRVAHGEDESKHLLVRCTKRWETSA